MQLRKSLGPHLVVAVASDYTVRHTTTSSTATAYNEPTMETKNLMESELTDN
jgi:hypothetical protein